MRTMFAFVLGLVAGAIATSATGAWLFKDTIGDDDEDWHSDNRGPVTENPVEKTTGPTVTVVEDEGR